jgi:hypothetical protein
MTITNIPPLDAAIMTRHQARLSVHQLQPPAKIVNLMAQQDAIVIAIAANPLDWAVLRDKMEVKDELLKAQFELTEELNIVLTMDKKAERSNVYRIFCEDEQRLVTNHGKVYTLTLGQRTQTLKDKLKEDGDWEDVAAHFYPIRLLKLIKKYVLKQTESHYPYLAIQEEMRGMLNFSQGEDMTLGTYYKKFNTCVAIAECAGCSFVTTSLLDNETEVMYPGTISFDDLQPDEQTMVEKSNRDKYLAVLYLMRSGK